MCVSLCARTQHGSCNVKVKIIVCVCVYHGGDKAVPGTRVRVGSEL